MICMAMSGNGAAIGMIVNTTQRARLLTQPAQAMANIVFFVVVAGTVVQNIAALLIAAMISPTKQARLVVSELSWTFKFLFGLGGLLLRKRNR